MRKTIIKLVTFLAGLYFFLEWIIPDIYLENVGFNIVHQKISVGVILVGSMAIGLGIINLIKVYGAKIVYKRKDYFYSYALFIGLILMFSVTILDWRAEIKSKENVKELRMLSDFSGIILKDLNDNKHTKIYSAKRISLLKNSLNNTLSKIKTEIKDFKKVLLENNLENIKFNNNAIDEDKLILNIESLLKNNIEVNQLEEVSSLINNISIIHNKQINIALEYSVIKKAWTILFNGLFVSLGSAMFSLLGVYIASAAFRAFRITSYESTFMLLAALLVMLGQISFGKFIYPDMPLIRQWLLEVPNSAIFRAIKIGSALAGVLLAYRMWFSIESDYKDEGS